ncbi:MAG: hypothetical protein K5873_12100 [Treponema sp.]|nr:hypothetical protein [Treponema sp.]
MDIDEGKLQDLLHQRKRYIKSNADVIASALALGAYIVTIVLADISSVALYKKLLVFAMALVYLAILIKSIFNSRYSVEAFLKDITDCGSQHDFSLLVLKDSHGRYLLKKDNRWNTFLFPYYRTKENDSQAALDFAKEALNLSSVSVKKSMEGDFTKRSVSANMTKTYHHTFYQLSFDSKDFAEKKSFKVDGVKYQWYSIDEIKSKKDLMLKNHETIEFVEKNF